MPQTTSLLRLRFLNAKRADKLFSDITEFRTMYDLPINSPENFDEKHDELHTNLIVEEMGEFGDALKNICRLDAIVDSVYVLMGRNVQHGKFLIELDHVIDLFLAMANRYELDFDAAWDEIHSSNMSKACKTQDEYDLTEAFYKERGVIVYPTHKGGLIIVKCKEETTFKGDIIKPGKVMKSVNYRPADLTQIVNRKVKMD